MPINLDEYRKQGLTDEDIIDTMVDADYSEDEIRQAFEIKPAKVRPEQKETIIARQEAEKVPEYGVKNPNLYAGVETGTKFAKGMGEEIVNLWNVAKHPIKTADNLIGLARGLAQYIPMKVTGGTPEDEQYKQVRYVEELGKNLGEYIYDSYGTYDNFKKQVNDNPVKIMRDLSSVLAVSSKVASGIGLQKTSEALGFAGTISAPQYVPEMAIKGAIKATAPIGKAMYSKAVGRFPSKTSLSERERIVSTGYTREIPISEKGIYKAENIKSELGKQINDIIDEGMKTKGTNSNISRKIIEDKLDEFKDSKYVVNSSDVEGTRAIIDEVKSNLMRDQPEILSLRKSQDLKQGLQKQVSDAYDEMSTFKKEAIKQEAWALREAIEEKVPVIKQANINQKDMIDFSEKLLKEVNRYSDKPIWSWRLGILPSVKYIADNPAMLSKLGIMIGKADKLNPLRNPKILRDNLLIEYGRLQSEENRIKEAQNANIQK